MSDRVSPFVRNVMTHAPDSEMTLTESLFDALGHLDGGGSIQEQQLDMFALVEEKKRSEGRSGNSEEIRIALGPLSECIYYVPQSVSVGPLHFAAVDMEEDIRPDITTHHALGPENHRGFNQCAPNHLPCVWTGSRMAGNSGLPPEAELKYRVQS